MGSVAVNHTLTTTASQQQQQQSQSESSSTPLATIVAVNLTKPGNLGSIYRNMSCFGIKELIHVYKSTVTPPVWNDVHRMQQIKALSRGTNLHTTRTLVQMNEYVSMLKQTREYCVTAITTSDKSSKERATKRARRDKLPSRPPIVAIETATNAVDITSFQFPKVCTIMVGSEGSGISPKILRSMVDGYDSFVVIPMHGQHHSLNVAMATGIALYEYRRQWPAM
jgi:tRNA G18 (ribose-2'-O)-methylase SpoU